MRRRIPLLTISVAAALFMAGIGDAAAFTPPSCVNNVKSKGDQVTSATSQLGSAVQADAAKGGPHAASAVKYANVAGACFRACTFVGQPTGPAQAQLCKAEAVAAGLNDVANSSEAACAATILAATHAINRTAQVASSSAASGSVRGAANNLVAALDAGRSATEQCAPAIKAALDSQMQANPSSSSNVQSAQAASTTAFQAIVHGFELVLETGSVAHSSANATMQATKASFWPQGNAALKATVKNGQIIVRKINTGASVGAAGQASGQAAGMMAPGGGVGSTMSVMGGGGAYSRFEGTGTLDLTLAGSTISIPNATFKTDDTGLMSITGGDVSIKGCTHQVAQASELTSTRLTLYGTLTCGGVPVTTSRLHLTSGALSGGGKLTAFSHAFDVAYSASGQQMKAAGTWNAEGEGWRNVPNVTGVQYAVSTPVVKVELASGGLSASFDAGKVEVKTTANKPNTTVPWAAASIDPAAITITSGRLPLPLPSLPQPSAIAGTVTSTLCDASCSFLQTVGLGGWVSSGTAVGSTGKLEYVDGNHKECRVKGGSLDGKCRANAGCLPTVEKFTDGSVAKCRTAGVAAPTVPTLPASISVSVEDVTR